MSCWSHLRLSLGAIVIVMVTPIVLLISAPACAQDWRDVPGST